MSNSRYRRFQTSDVAEVQNRTTLATRKCKTLSLSEYSSRPIEAKPCSVATRRDQSNSFDTIESVGFRVV